MCISSFPNTKEFGIFVDDGAGQCVCVSEWNSLSQVWLFATPWTLACQALLSVEFSRQEYWSGLPFLQSLVNRVVEEETGDVGRVWGMKELYRTFKEFRFHSQCIVNLLESNMNRFILLNDHCFPQKVKHRVTIWPRNSTPRYISKIIENIHPYKNLYRIHKMCQQPKYSSMDK